MIDTPIRKRFEDKPLGVYIFCRADIKRQRRFLCHTLRKKEVAVAGEDLLVALTAMVQVKYPITITMTVLSLILVIIPVAVAAAVERCDVHAVVVRGKSMKMNM
jgi:hypothetical protein